MPPPKNETAEQKRRRLEKDRAKRKQRREEETPEEKRKRLEKQHKKRVELRSRETSEERRERLERQCEKARKRRSRETPEQHKERLDRGRKKKVERTSTWKSERKEEARQKAKFYQLVRSLQMTEEQKEAQRLKGYFYRESIKEKRKWKNLPEEERERLKQRARNWKAKLTGEKKQRHEESVRRALKKSQQKMYKKIKEDPERWEQFKQYQRERYQKETPEERLQRQRKDKVNLAKGKLRRALQEEGVSQEEIERRLEELKERMWREFYPKGDVPPPGTRKRGPPGGPKRKFPNVPTKGPPKESPLVPQEAPPVVGEKRPVTPENVKVEDIPHFKVEAEVIIPDEDPEPCVTPEYFGSSTPLPSPSPPGSPFPPMKEEYVAGIPIPVEELPFTCSHCPSQFSGDTPLRSHVLSSHANKCWKCPKCEELVLSPFELSEHFTTTHKNERRPPPPKKAPPSPADPSKYVCMKCPPQKIRKFPSRNALFAHVKERHPQQFWPCDYCQLLKYSVEALVFHYRVCRPCPKSENAS